MVSADFLKLRKRRGTLIWSLVLAVLPLIVFFVVRAVQHSSEPQVHGPAGGIVGFHDAIRVLAAVFAPLAAIMIGADGGAGDVAAGVFRDLVVTGRSRVALFASRVPAALALSLLVAGAGFVVLVIGTFVFASGTATPSASLFLEGFGFTMLSTGVVCAIAVGFSALTASRPAALTVMIGWYLVAGPILASIGSLGNVRRIILSQAVEHFSPVTLGDGPQRTQVTMSLVEALIVLVVWLAVFLALGAWRTKRMDA
jgi:ABC-type transport system involved in multi-copper enzyme maturation permease subunit